MPSWKAALRGQATKCGSARIWCARHPKHICGQKATSVICATFFHCKAIWPKQSRTKFRLS